MAKERVNITVDPDMLDEFYELAAKKGIKFSTWVQAQMEQFIEEERMIEEFRRKKRSE